MYNKMHFIVIKIMYYSIYNYVGIHQNDTHEQVDLSFFF